MESCDETHTSIADDFEERAKNVDVPTNNPHSSCYDGLMEQTELLRRARKHQEEARKIRKILLDIDKEGKSIPADSEMLRKGVLTVSRGKALFSTDQLIQVCIHMFEGLPFVAFKGPADARPQSRSTPTSGPPPKVSARAPALRSYHFRGVKLKSCIKKIHHNLYISKQANVTIKHADTEGASHKKFGTDARVQ